MKEIFWLKCKWSCRSHIPSKTFQLISRLNQRLIAGWCWETFPIRQIPATFTSPHSILDNLSSSSALEKGIDPIWRKSCTKQFRNDQHNCCSDELLYVAESPVSSTCPVLINSSSEITRDGRPLSRGIHQRLPLIRGHQNSEQKQTIRLSGRNWKFWI